MEDNNSTNLVLDVLLNRYNENTQDSMSDDTYEFMETWRKSNPRKFRNERRKAEHKLKKLEKKNKGI